MASFLCGPTHAHAPPTAATRTPAPRRGGGDDTDTIGSGLSPRRRVDTATAHSNAVKQPPLRPPRARPPRREQVPRGRDGRKRSEQRPVRDAHDERAAGAAGARAAAAGRDDGDRGRRRGRGRAVARFHRLVDPRLGGGRKACATMVYCCDVVAHCTIQLSTDVASMIRPRPPSLFPRARNAQSGSAHARRRRTKRAERSGRAGRTSRSRHGGQTLPCCRTQNVTTWRDRSEARSTAHV